MAETTNQQIADQLTARQLRAGRVETALRRDVWAMLAVLEAEILAALKANDPTEFVLLARRRREVERLMAEEIDPLITARYARLARLMDEAMGRLAVNEAEAVQRIVNGETEEETIAETPSDAAVKRRVAGALFPTPTRPTDLSATGSDWWVRQGESLSQRLGDSLLVGVSLEESRTQLTQRVRGTSDNGFQDGIMAKARDDASRLLTTQVTNAVGEARVAVAERNTQQVVLQHQALIEEKNVCMTCFVRHGKRYTAAAPHEPLGHDIPYLSGVPYHPLCVVGDTMVTALGIQGTSQREYVGPVITLRTYSGYELTCTPNHPILTDQGWIAAHQLNIGSCLVCCTRQERPIHLVDMNGENGPSRMQDIVEAFQQTSSVASMPVPVTAEDFHGDGMGSKIAIVGTNGLLRDGRNASLLQPMIDLHFQGLHHPLLLSRLGDAFLRFRRPLAAATSDIGRQGLSSTLFERPVSPFFLFLFTLCSERDRMLAQQPSNNRTTDIIALGQCIEGKTALVGRNQFLDGEDMSIGTYDTQFVESFEEHATLHTILAGNTAHTFPGEIFFDDVIHRKVDHWRGHVYNLQTLSGWFIANNIIIHNCRCSMVTVVASGGTITDETLAAWLRRQGTAYQNAVLGPTRAQMFRAGRLSLRDLIAASTGKPLTLEELGA